MRTGRTIGRSRRAGFTLIETLLATSVFLVIGGSLTMAAIAAQRSHAAVVGGSLRNRALRRCSARLLRDLRASIDARIVLGQSADGNAELTLQTSVDVGGNTTWGVEVETPGAVPPLQVQPNWSLRYTVVAIPQGGGTVVRELRREILDAGGTQRGSTVLVRGIRSGAAQPPGFAVVKNGATWQVTISVDDGEIASGYRKVEFHGSTRN